MKFFFVLICLFYFNDSRSQVPKEIIGTWQPAILKMDGVYADFIKDSFTTALEGDSLAKANTFRFLKESFGTMQFKFDENAGCEMLFGLNNIAGCTVKYTMSRDTIFLSSQNSPDKDLHFTGNLISPKILTIEAKLEDDHLILLMKKESN